MNNKLSYLITAMIFGLLYTISFLYPIRGMISTRMDMGPNMDEHASGFRQICASKECENSLENITSSLSPPILLDEREALRFIFKGYTLWLELESFPIEVKLKGSGNMTVPDLDHIISLAASEKGLQPIPKPHVTILYGMTQFDNEEAVKSIFNGKLKETLELMKADNTKNGLSSALKVQNGFFGVTYDGVDGEEMDMAWTEISLSASPEHFELLDVVYEIFYDKRRNKEQKWNPHLSLAYDNPENTILNLNAVNDLISHFPSLMKERKIEAVSLWSTQGRMSDWKCLDRISFDN